MKKIPSGLEAKFTPKTSIFGEKSVEKNVEKDKEEKKNEVEKDKKNRKIKKDKEEKKNEVEKDKKSDNINKKSTKDKESKRLKLKDSNLCSIPKKRHHIEDSSKKYKKEDSSKKEHKKDEKMKTPMTKIEKKILTNGTTKDKINVLTLQVERYPSVENYKNLLVYSENQRNDVIYETLKNLKDLLISKGEVKDWYLKQRIVKTFEINLKNIFIKQKVLKLVYQLLKNNIYFLELIYPFLNKLGDKKELEEFVIENCKTLFPIQEDIILENIEDFFFKNSSFKARYSLLKLIGEVTPTNKKNLLEIYLKFGEALDLNIPDEQRMILLKLFLKGLASYLEINNCDREDDNCNSKKDDNCDNNNNNNNNDNNNNREKHFINTTLSNNILQILKTSVCPELSLPIFKILYITNPPCTREILYKILSHPPTEELMALVFKYILENDDKKMLKYILNRSLLYKKEMVLAILYLINRNKDMNIKEYYGLSILLNHYSLVVRNTVIKMCNKEEIREIKPFDLIDFEMHENY